MDIKDKVSPEDKAQLAMLALETEVLNNIFQQHKAMTDQKAGQVLAKAGCSPDLYSLTFSPDQDVWEAELKEGALVLPNREARRSMKGRQN